MANTRHPSPATLIRERYENTVMGAQANAFREWVKGGSVRRDPRYTPNPPALRVRPVQKIFKIHMAGENWTRTQKVMARTKEDAEAIAVKNGKGKVIKAELLCEVPPISRVLQSTIRGFFRKLFGERHNQDHCRGDGKPLCHICGDMRHLWVRVDDDMVALRCVACDPISAKEQARVQRELLRVADTLADLRQPVCI